jgi:hypothetical protein
MHPGHGSHKNGNRGTERVKEYCVVLMGEYSRYLNCPPIQAIPEKWKGMD